MIRRKQNFEHIKAFRFFYSYNPYSFLAPEVHSDCSTDNYLCLYLYLCVCICSQVANEVEVQYNWVLILAREHEGGQRRFSSSHLRSVFSIFEKSLFFQNILENSFQIEKLPFLILILMHQSSFFMVQSLKYRQSIKFEKLCIFNAHEESSFNNQGKCDKASATENFHLHSQGSFANRPPCTFKGLWSDCISRAHSAIWGKLGTAYTLNPCTKFPPNPTSAKVIT